LGPDSPPSDAPADQVEPGSDAKDVSGTDGKEGGITSDADGGVPHAEAGPDTSRQESAPDLAPDLKPDLAPDLAPDLKSDASTLASGLLVYYKCESATGTILQDSSGNGNNGTLAGSGYSFPTGRVGKALSLAKAGQGYVSVPSAVFANATTITVATWVNVTTAQSWQRVFDTGINAKLAGNSSTGTRYMNLVPKDSGTNLAFAISQDGYGSEQVLSSPAQATGTWTHVAVVLSAGQGILYVDGAVAQASASILLRPANLGAIDYAYLGKSQFTNDPYFDGQLDEFRVYNRALSAAEIQALYQFVGP